MSPVFPPPVSPLPAVTLVISPTGVVEVIVIVSFVASVESDIFVPATNVKVSLLLSATTVL